MDHRPPAARYRAAAGERHRGWGRPGLSGAHLRRAESRRGDLDTVVLRPLCMAMGIRWLGANLGTLLGKLTADLRFYGPVLTICAHDSDIE